MKKTLEVFKAINSKNEGLIKFMSGLTTVILSIITFLTKVLETKLNISLFLIGLLIITQRVCKEIINSKREAFGIITATYSKRSILIGKIVKYSSWCLLIFPAVVLINTIIPKKKECNSQMPNLGVLITNFTNSTENDFSYKLFTTLCSKLQDIDTIKPIQVDHFVNLSKLNYQDSLTNTFKKNCVNHGLLVFGKRNEQTKLFDCSIFIHNLTQLKNTSDINKQNILFLQNPDQVNFSLDDQANIVSEFIMGLLFYNSHNYDYSINSFNQVLNSSSNTHSKIRSFCHFYLGNNLIQQKKTMEAINAYKLGLDLDSLNSFLHYNLGLALAMRSDSLNAFQEFEYAIKLNPKFSNPIKNLITQNSNQIELASNISKKISKSSTPETSTTGSQTEEIRPNINTQTIKRTNAEFAIKNNGTKYGVVDSTGETVITFAFDSIDPKIFDYQGFRFFIVQRGGKYGAMKVRGYLEVPTIHPSADYVRAILKTTIDLAPETLSH